MIGSAHHRRRPWLALGAAAVLLAVAALVAARAAVERRALRRALPVVDGRLEVRGLGRELEIVRDARGVPHVRAASDDDAWFGLGFVHAQDRLAQMTWLVRAARGRTAEVVGPEGLEADRWSRTLGFGALGEAQAARLGPATRRALEAYAAGVNAWTSRIEEGLAPVPVALARLGVRPETWTPADTLAVGKLLAWVLDGSIDATLVVWDLIERLGGFAARPFLPPGAASELVPVPLPHLEARGLPPRRELAGLLALRRATGLEGSSVGSSAWVVAGVRAAGGRPILAGDLHLEPTAPPLLHEAQLSAPGLVLAGAGPPGVPVFWSGHNGRVAWAATHARAVAADVYLEAVERGLPGHYRSGGRRLPLELREERIEVAGGKGETLVVRATRHGPLLDALEPGRPALAVAWAGAQPGDGVAALLRAAHARDAAELRAALADHHEPVFAFVYADVHGSGGRQVAGWLPRRPMSTGLVPVPGRTTWSDWRGRVPFEELPHAPLTGDWVVSADAALAAGAAPLEWWWQPGERAARIEALLRERVAQGRVDAGAIASLQSDVVSAAALARVRFVLELVGDPRGLPPEARQVTTLLAGWDGSTRAESVGAAAWHVLQASLVRRLLEEPLGEALLDRYLALRGVRIEALLDALVASAQAASHDPDALVDRPTLRAAALEALRRTGLALRVRLGANPEKWHWGRLHALRFRSFGWTDAAWDGPRADEALAFGGDGVTIAVGEYDASDPYDVRVVSAYRLVVDLASPELALSALAPGESEHPGDPRRTAGLARWLAGRPSLLATHRFVVDEGAQARLVLAPAGG